MRATVIVLLATIAATPAPAQEDAVRKAEIAFAKAFADRDSEAFFSMVANDATFLGFGTSRGKEQVVATWSRYFQSPQAPFSWGPERVSLSADGKLGLSTGPVYDPQGNHVGDYNSTWRKEPDGSWKIVFDSSGPGPAPLPESALKVEEGYATADDGLRLYYRKVGQGPVTLIAPLDFIFFDQLKQFAGMATVITYDPRNRGRSDRSPNRQTWTIQQDVKDLEAVRRHLQVGKFVPVGYSYLGLMVVLYTLDHPQPVTRIVQLGPGTWDQSREYTPETSDPGAPQADVEARKAAQDKPPREQCEAGFRVFRYTLVGKPGNAEKIESWCALENEWPVNFFAHLDVLWPSVEALKITPADLKRVTVPVLTIHGTKDRNSPYGAGRDWAQALPDARLVTIEGAAHNSWEDDPAAVFAAIRHFIRGEWPLGSEKVAPPTAAAPASGRETTPTAPAPGGSALPRPE